MYNKNQENSATYSNTTMIKAPWFWCRINRSRGQNRVRNTNKSNKCGNVLYDKSDILKCVEKIDYSMHNVKASEWLSEKKMESYLTHYANTYYARCSRI